MKKVILSKQQDGNSVALLEQRTKEGKLAGFYELELKQAGKRAQSLGVFPKAHLVAALSEYHSSVEMLEALGVFYAA